MSSPADDIIDLYRRHAVAWTTARGDVLHERGWMEAFAGLMAPGASVLDIGCGSGVPVARFLVARGHDVTGIDSSPEMIALFRQNLPGMGSAVADMRMLDLGRRFGGVLAWDSFFHLTAEDQRGMFAVFGAHAAPGAPLMFTSGPGAGEALGVLEGDVLYHASLSGEDYRALLDGAGFDVVRHVPEDPACGGRTVWLAQTR